MVAVAAKYH